MHSFSIRVLYCFTCSLIWATQKLNSHERERRMPQVFFTAHVDFNRRERGSKSIKKESSVWEYFLCSFSPNINGNTLIAELVWRGPKNSEISHENVWYLAKRNVAVLGEFCFSFSIVIDDPSFLPCPQTLVQAMADRGRFTIDEYCNPEAEEQCVRYHYKATHCFRTNTPR